jgi:uncharacterized protein (TIGR02466 family)
MNNAASPEFANTTLVKVFATPFIRHLWADTAELNDGLRRTILAYEREHKAGRAKSNVGGWQSEAGQLEWCGDAGKTLVRYMFALADEATRQLLSEYTPNPPRMQWKLDAWVNVNRPGDFNRTHAHPGATWSGTYYVDPGAPDDPEGTPINLLNACQGSAVSFFPNLVPSGIFVRPEPGLMILFPGYLPHSVFPHHGKRPRISIAFNLAKEPYP